MTARGDCIGCLKRRLIVSNKYVGNIYFYQKKYVINSMRKYEFSSHQSFSSHLFKISELTKFKAIPSYASNVYDCIELIRGFSY